MKPLILTQEALEYMMEDNMGVCTECGNEQDCCEPDARRYTCEDCGSRSVYGMDELLCMGMIELEEVI